MRLLILVFILGLVPRAQSSELRTVLTTSAYGAGVGALVGVTALAFSDSPGQNLNLVARGASLGLYAGLAVGIYLASQPESGTSLTVLSTSAGDLVPALAFKAQF